MRSQFRDLTAYQSATDIAHEVHRSVVSWPKWEMWSLGSQLTRAADSVGANIAEAEGRWYPRDKRRLLLIARGSLYETEHWIAYAQARGLLVQGFEERLDRVAWALNGLIKHWSKR